MKSLITIFLLIPILGLCQSDKHVVGINKGTFNKETDTLIEQDFLDSYIKYTSDEQYTTLWMDEFDEDGKELKHVRMSVVRKTEDKEAMTFDIQGDEFNYQILFWKDGSMVVYRFSDTYVILSGAIEY